MDNWLLLLLLLAPLFMSYVLLILLLLLLLQSLLFLVLCFIVVISISVIYVIAFVVLNIKYIYSYITVPHRHIPHHHKQTMSMHREKNVQGSKVWLHCKNQHLYLEHFHCDVSVAVDLRDKIHVWWWTEIPQNSVNAYFCFL